jgi:uncharacterized protein YihD (DUF1040 family)
MRDPARIDRIVGLLRRYWHQYPDLRLGQLIVNVTGSSDPFYREDDQTEQQLRAALGLNKTDDV